MKLVIAFLAFAAACFAQNPSPCTAVQNAATSGQVLSAATSGRPPQCIWITGGGGGGGISSVIGTAPITITNGTTTPNVKCLTCVVGPASATSGHVATFNGTTGKLVQDGGALPTVTGGTCTNQFVSAISSSAVPTCTTVTLAGAQFANQGTTTTVLHGNAAGNPSFAQVSLTADVTGVLPTANIAVALANQTSLRGNSMAAAAGDATITQTIAHGTKALATGAISSATCTTAQTATATGTLTTDVIDVSFNGDPTAVTGYVPLTAGMLTIIAYPTADTFNVKVCNNTSGSITPGAITLNFAVRR